MANKNLKSIKFPGLSDTYVVPQVDSTLTQTGRPADAKATGDEIAGLKEDLSTLNTEGTVPTSAQMLSDNYTEDSVPYHFRKTASDNADREELEIVGGSVAWNQLRMPSFPANATTNEVTVVNNGDGSASLSGTATAQTRFLVTSASVPTNHVMLVYGCPTGGGTSTYCLVDNFQQSNHYDTGAGMVYKIDGSSAKANVQIQIGNEYAISGSLKFIPQVHDLTAMFGSTIADHIYSLEQATAGAGVALFRSLFPKDYYPYDAGSIQSVSGLSEHRTVGFNQWDEVWEVGGLNGSGATNEHDRIRTKNYIPCLPNTQYFYQIPSGKGNMQIWFYDSDKNYLSYYNFTTEHLFTTPQNCRYMRANTGGSYGATYNHDICINLSDSAKNGTYEPYSAHSYALDDSLTLRGVPTLVDGKIKWDGDLYAPSGKVTRRYGVYTFTGNEVWGTYTAWGSDHTFMSGALSGINITATTRQILTTVLSLATILSLTGCGGDKAVESLTIESGLEYTHLVDSD